jgi:mRNA interferase RelE/StbE
MNPYQLVLTVEARSDIRRLAKNVRTRVFERLAWLAENAGQFQHHALQGSEWGGSYRFRIGDYRVINQLDRTERLLTVLRAGHRRDVYR